MNDATVPFNLDVTLGQASFSASGSSEDVLNAFADFQELIASPPLQNIGSSSDGASRASDDELLPIVPPLQGGDAEDERVPLRVFLDAKVLPRGNSVIALGIATWAKRYDNTYEVDAETMKQLWRISGKKIPTNIPRDLNTAASEGWLERRGKGSFSVTSYGEKHFDNFDSTTR
ncbi:hypothetical protein JOE31_003569 [Arthrobacter sp. PvP023]|uniref:hypothetical protein n=1 Tax=Micrococcaceae TaxID=1268 RepID=UPI001AE492CD|nr:hypothetical protein [Arthrobacter sp. PvP023]MBP1137337.1 hypothetical protein [Arthrobacter sp. PvP023]